MDVDVESNICSLLLSLSVDRGPLCEFCMALVYVT
jgi:hypothetical protein